MRFLQKLRMNRYSRYMGRRIVYHETRNGANYINAKFVYNGYLCIQRLYGSSNGVYQSFVWDPTEPVATRPLSLQIPSWGATIFYMHDGNKNVSDLIYYALANGIAAHYDYAPFGAVARTARDTRMTQHTFIAENPFRFSSEYHDNSLGLVYYNYRHYNPKDGRWLCKDSLGEYWSLGLYSFLSNNCQNYIDVYGLCCCGDCQIKDFKYLGPVIVGFRLVSGAGKEFGEVSLEKALHEITDDIKESVFENFVNQHGNYLIKSIFEARKIILNQKSQWETIANFSVSTGYLFEPQLQIAAVVNYQRRDCRKPWWSFLRDGCCTWDNWESYHIVTKAEWVSPPSNFIDSKFDLAGMVINPQDALGKIIEDLTCIVDSFDMEMFFDVEMYKSSLGCEIIE